MNSIIESLINRKSVRTFEKIEISPKIKQSILEAAVQAPTAGNQQLYTILDITDQTLKDNLAKSCDNQAFIAKAPLVFVFCADAKKWYDAYLVTNSHPRRPAVGDLMLAVSDAMIAAQNAVVAAESYGLGSCYIGDIMEQYENNRELLALPEYVFPAAMLVMGIPTAQQMQRPKPVRVDLSYIVRENQYKEMGEDELKEMWCVKSGTQSYEEWMHAFCERKYNAAFSVEMSRSVAKYLAQFQNI